MKKAAQTMVGFSEATTVLLGDSWPLPPFVAFERLCHSLFNHTNRPVTQQIS